MRIVHRHGIGLGRNYFESHWIHFRFTLFACIDLTSLLDMPLRIGMQHSERIMTAIRTGLEAKYGEELKDTIISNRVALEILEIILDVSTPNPERMRQFEAMSRFIPLFKFLKDNLHRPVSVDEMAGISNTSLAHFHHVFRESLGYSPMNYLKKLRLDRAGQLLVYTDESIADIADRVGFKNQFHFSREFRRGSGVSPSVYHRENRW